MPHPPLFTKIELFSAPRPCPSSQGPPPSLPPHPHLSERPSRFLSGSHWLSFLYATSLHLRCRLSVLQGPGPGRQWCISLLSVPSTWAAGHGVSVILTAMILAQSLLSTPSKYSVGNGTSNPKQWNVILPWKGRNLKTLSLVKKPDTRSQKAGFYLQEVSREENP